MKKSYLLIQNSGEIESEALSLIGASTKRDNQTKIGMFGSGNKYAIAYLLRNRIGVRIFSGTEEIEITTKERNFRGMDFDQILVRGQETSLTTDMGPKWELWQAIREIYSNAKDEEDAQIKVVHDGVSPIPGKTQFYIEYTNEVMDFFRDIDIYFSDNRKEIYRNEHGAIYNRMGDSMNLYRKGIRCYPKKQTSAFDYNFENIDITEDRIIKWSYEALECIWKLLFSCDDLYVIRKILFTAPREGYEFALGAYTSLDFGLKPTRAWVEALNGKKICPFYYHVLLSSEEAKDVVFLPVLICNALMEAYPDEIKEVSFSKSSDGIVFKPHTMTEYCMQAIKQATDFLEECRFDVPYEIEVVHFSDSTIMGSCHNGKILLSRICLEKGTSYVVNTIIEEYIHIKHGVNDKTREFQDAAIGELVAYMEKTNSYKL